MSNAARFLPWTRRAVFPGDSIQLRAAGRDLTIPLSQYGPGDVVGIAPGQIRRREPLAGSLGFAPNLLPYVEFRTPDFPWCLTPEEPDAQNRLKPWLALIIRDAPQSTPLGRSGKGTLPVINVPEKELPPQDELAVWAHVQVDGDVPQTQAVVDQGISRLVSPRKLTPLTRYIACLVPVYESGRLAGLGEAPPDPRSTTPSWGGGAGAVVLPVYEHWFFTTADSGDLETLARRLRGKDLSSSSRPLRLDVSSVAGDVGGKIAPFNGALRPAGMEPAWDGSAVAASEQRLRDLLSHDAAGQTPVVGPPVYGSIATRRDTPVSGWSAQLNLDPRRRAAAGLGVAIVQSNQDELVDEAWRQVGDIERARREREGALLAQLTAGRLHGRTVAPLEGASSLVTLGPALARLRENTPLNRSSVAARLASSRLLPAALSPAFRRILTTKTSTASRRAGQGIKRMLEIRNDIAVTPAAAPPTPSGLVTAQDLTVAMQRTDFTARLPVGRFVLKPAQKRILDAAAPLLAARKPAIVEAVRPRAFAWTRPPAPAQAMARFERRVDVGTVGRIPGRNAAIVSSPRIDVPLAAWLPPAMLLAGVELPPDTMGLLEVNVEFVEALLLGANHELARELLWRGVPLERSVTLLTRFFESVVSSPPRDMTQIASWQPGEALGSHVSLGERSVFVIRSRLVSRMSEAVVFAAQAEMNRGFRVPGATQRIPLFRGLAGTDTAYFGFDIKPDEMAGSNSHAGWYLVIQERAGAARFGLDEEAPEVLRTWNDLAWPMVSVSSGHLNLAPLRPAPNESNGFVWGHNAAHMAAIGMQRPIRLAIHASQLMPPKKED